MDHVEWKAVEEGLRLLDRDLAKLQVMTPLCISFDIVLLIISSNLLTLTRLVSGKS